MEHQPLDAQLYSIGVIRNPDKKLEAGAEGTAEAHIEIDEQYADALLRIDDYSELTIVYWLHRIREDQRDVLQVHPRGDRTRPMRGVFATRSPMRPNPIAITRVRLLRREGTVLVVEGLDAVDGSPLLDVKMGKG